MTQQTPEQARAEWERLSPADKRETALVNVLVHADALVHAEPGTDPRDRQQEKIDDLHAAVDFAAALLREQAEADAAKGQERGTGLYL